MFNFYLVLFIFAELSYYLLIAQTGIVEVFHSDIMSILYLPIGGIIGTYLSGIVPIPSFIKVVILLYLQAIITFFYPHLSAFMLFILGISVGGVSVFIIQTLKRASTLTLGVAFAAAYSFSTLMFTTDPFYRETLGVILSIVAIFGYIFSQEHQKESFSSINLSYTFPLYLMFFWVVLDSSLFETLSRDPIISIWRGGYSFEIILFHILGVITALTLQMHYNYRSLLISVLFILSYLFYFTHNALLLSIVYPFVISYYNIVIIQSLMNISSLKKIAVFMIFIGWVSSGIGLSVGVEGWSNFVPILLLSILLFDLFKLLNFKKGVISWLKH